MGCFMPAIPWILIGILVLLLLFAVVSILAKKKNKRPTDYYALFIIGIIWFVIGIPIGNLTLSIIGTIFVVIGFVNKDKWKKNHIPWNKLTKEEKRLKMFIIAALALIVLVGLVAFLIYGA